MDLDKRMADYQAFLQKVEAMKGRYESARDVRGLEDGVRKRAQDPGRGRPSWTGSGRNSPGAASRRLWIPSRTPWTGWRRRA